MDFGPKRQMEYSAEDLVNLELAYATTIHKAMGSEYRFVILPVMKAHAVMFYRNLLYTAVTRAKEGVVLVGQKEIMYMAIHRNEMNSRNTLLSQRIRLYYRAFAKGAGIPIPHELERELKNAS